MSSFRIILLILFKNYKKQKKQKISFFIVIITSVLFPLCIVPLKQSVVREKLDLGLVLENIQFDLWWESLVDKINSRRDRMVNWRTNFHSNVFVPQIIIGYAPNTTVAIHKLIEGAMSRIAMMPPQLASFTDCGELRRKAYAEQFLASVCFHDVDESRNGLPSQLHFSILMPSELRLYEDSWIGNAWQTDWFFGINPIRDKGNRSDSIPNYVREGFISLQHSIGMEYLHLASGNTNIPKILLTAYTFNRNVESKLMLGIDTSVIVLLIGFMCPVTILTMNIVEERALSIHFTLHTNSRTMRLQFAVWYLIGVCLLLLTSLIFTIMLKIRFNGSTAAFNKCPWYIMMFFFTSYILSAVAFSLLMAVVLGSSKCVVEALPIYWVLISLPLLSRQSVDSTWSYFFLIATSILFCNVAMCRGMRSILSYEHLMRPLNCREYLLSKLTTRDPNLLMFIVVFYVQAVLYVILALILDGTLSPCLQKTMKCICLRHLFSRIRRKQKKRRRRRQRALAEQVELTDNLSRIMSEHADLNEEQIKVTSLNSKSSSSTISDSLPELRNVTYGSRHSPSLQFGELQSRRQFGIQEWERRNSPKIFFDDREARTIVIEVKDVWKKFQKSFVIRDFSLSVYANEIIVLLGHNASGKTTLLNMICGKTQPTSGSIHLSGYHVEKQSNRGLQQVTMSLKQTSLYSELTLYEHILYLCQMRGLSYKESVTDADAYVESMQLKGLRHRQVASLTWTQQRLLQVLSAFAGRSTVVLLDKPMDCIDPEKRKLFYKFTHKEKKTRTIIITTNFPLLAKNMADRVVLLIQGNIYAMGPEKELLKLEKPIYRLVCYMEAEGSYLNLIEYLESQIPVEVEFRTNDSVTLLFEETDFDMLVHVCHVLDTSMEELHISSYKLICPNMEHLLLTAMGHTHHSPHFDHTLFKLSRHIRDIDEKRARYRWSLLPGFYRALTHINVVLRKRLLVDIRSYAKPLLQLLLPSIMCIAVLCKPEVGIHRKVLNTLSFTMSCFQDSMTLVQQGSATLDPITAAAKHYLGQVAQGRAVINVQKHEQLFEVMTLRMKEANLISDLNFVIAAIFKDETVEALFNHNILHADPVSLTILLNSLAVGFVGPSSGIRVNLELLPYSTLHTVLLNDWARSLAFIFNIVASLSFCFLWSLSLLNFGLKRGMPHTQFEYVSGLSFGAVIFANFIYDITKVVLSLIPMNAVTLIFYNIIQQNVYGNYKFNYVILVCGLYVLSIDTFISYWISELRFGYTFVILIYSAGIMAFLVFSENSDVNFNEIGYYLSFHPYFALLRNLIAIHNETETVNSCADKQTFETSVYCEDCRKIPNCCNFYPEDYASVNMVWHAYTVCILIWLFFLARPSFIYRRLQMQIFKQRINKNTDPAGWHDQNVHHFGIRSIADQTCINEKLRIRTPEGPYLQAKALIAKNLGVVFATHAVLAKINFFLERHQILCVMGLNGEGKSMLMKILCGLVAPTTGYIRRYRDPLHRHEDYVTRRHVSYCGQEDEMKDELTIAEVIQMVLITRGLTRSAANKQTAILMRLFGLFHYRHHLLPYCSRGILKRVNVTICLIGNSSLILLDDPFSCLDVSSGRKIAALLETQCTNGQSVVYTTSDAGFGEVANRIAILHDSNLIAIGSRRDLLPPRYLSFITVETRINFEYYKHEFQKDLPLGSELPAEDSWDYLHIVSIVEKTFPHAIIKTFNKHKVRLCLSTEHYNMAEILQRLHIHKHVFVSFSIWTSNLASSFNAIIKGPQTIIQNTDSYEY